MLGRDCPPRHCRKEGWSLVPRLPLDARPVDRPPVEPGRSAGLQPRHAEAKRSERAGKAERWRLPHATARASLQPGKELRSEEHTSELQSLMRISYAVFCLKKNKTPPQ